MTSEIAGVAGRRALIVFHWLLCSVLGDYICCAAGRCMLWAVGSEHARYRGYLKNYSVGSEYLEVFSEASSCVIDF